MKFLSRRGVMIAMSSLAMAGFVTSARGSGDWTIVAFGDSLTAGYGLPEEEAFTTRLQTALVEREKLRVEVVNAGVSGDTTKAGLARLDWSVPESANLVILELGANDALRGISPAESRANLEAMIVRLKERDIPVLLAGMLAPPNMGADYEKAFNAIYPELAEKYDVPLYPFFLDGVASVSELNQADGIHPNAEGTMVIVGKLAPVVAQLIRQLGH